MPAKMSREVLKVIFFICNFFKDSYVDLIDKTYKKAVANKNIKNMNLIALSVTILKAER